MSEIFGRIYIETYKGSGQGSYWTGYECSTCLSVTLAQSEQSSPHNTRPIINNLFPRTKETSDEIPVQARSYLRQAIESVHSPDGATMLAGSAVDAMLKEKGLNEGSVYARIEEAAAKNILTKDMSEWAHSVRLGANRIRHADKHQPTASTEEAKQAIEFVETLAQVLYVIPSKVAKGLESAESSSETDD